MNIREAIRKPPRSAPQLLCLPNRDAVLAAFRRAQTYPLDLIDIELETHHSITYGHSYKLVAFIRQDRLHAQHMLMDPTPRSLIGGAEILAQTLSMTMRRRYPDGYERAPRGVQLRQPAKS